MSVQPQLASRVQYGQYVCNWTGQVKLDTSFKLLTSSEVVPFLFPLQISGALKSSTPFTEIVIQNFAVKIYEFLFYYLETFYAIDSVQADGAFKMI